MAETNSAPQSAVDETQPILNYEKIYVKDMSIEIPHAPSIFLEQDTPGLETQLNVNASNFADGLYEVVVTVAVTTTSYSPSAKLFASTLSCVSRAGASCSRKIAGAWGISIDMSLT